MPSSLMPCRSNDNGAAFIPLIHSVFWESMAYTQLILGYGENSLQRFLALIVDNRWILCRGDVRFHLTS